jgi:hypothetical protein
METFQNLRVYRLSENLANEIWFIVQKWDYFAKDTIGKQIVKSADSIIIVDSQQSSVINHQSPVILN